jgi:polyphosphate kinase
MGFCSETSARRILEICPHLEALLIESGITILNHFLTVSEEEQERRFRRRIEDPLRQWKLSPWIWSPTGAGGVAAEAFRQFR